MPDYDLRLDVPFRAFVNAKLIWLVQQGGTLWEAKRHLLPQVGLSDEQIYGYHLYDPAMALSLLYCMIVVPRELLSLPENHQLYRDFDAQKKVPSISRTSSRRWIRTLSYVVSETHGHMRCSRSVRSTAKPAMSFTQSRSQFSSVR